MPKGMGYGKGMKKYGSHKKDMSYGKNPKPGKQYEKGKNPVKSSASGIHGSDRMPNKSGKAKHSDGMTGGENYHYYPETHKGAVPPGKGGKHRLATSSEDY